MKEALYSYINPGIVHFMAYPQTMYGEGPIIETLEKIALDDFFSSIEITLIKDKDIKEKAKKLLAAAHMDVFYCVHPQLLSNGLDLNSFDKKMREKAVAEVIKGVNNAFEFSAKAVVFLSGKNVNNNEQEHAIEILADSIEQICDYATKKDELLKVVLEVFDYDMDKKLLVGSSKTAKKLADKVTSNYDNFGLLIDHGHLPLMKESTIKAVDLLKDYLTHVHIGNAVLNRENLLYGDTHPRYGIDDGENDVEELIEFLDTLIDVGYLKYNKPKTISFEVKPTQGESSEIVIANGKRVLKKALARL